MPIELPIDCGVGLRGPIDCGVGLLGPIEWCFADQIKMFIRTQVVMKQRTEGYFQQRQPHIVANSGAIVAQ